MKANVSTQELQLRPGKYSALFVWRRVLQIVEEDSKRLNMSNWQTQLQAVHPTKRPSCGSIMCFAGWYNHVTTGDAFGNEPYRLASKTALRHMGINNLYAGEVHSVLGDKLFRLFHSHACSNVDAVARLTTILSEHEVELNLIHVEVK